MTSEKELRRYVQQEVCRAVAGYEGFGEDFPDLTKEQRERAEDLFFNWPIPDLPPADRDGCWWPKHGRNYGHVKSAQTSDIYGTPIPGSSHVTIARGSDSIHLTPAEAEELASLLLAAAHYERNQE